MFWSWINAYNYIVSSVASLSLYPILFVDYLPWDVGPDITWWQAILIKLGFCLVLTLINVLGITWISRLSLIFLIFIITPFIGNSYFYFYCLFLFVSFYLYLFFFQVETVAAPILVDMHWADMFTPSSFGSVHWGLFLSTVLWSYGMHLSSLSLCLSLSRDSYISGYGKK